MFNKKWPHYSEAEIKAVTQVLSSGKVNYWTGEQGKLFEKEYAEYLGLPYTIAISNGTNALELCLQALNIGPQDEVIVPARTFIASASCVVRVGATPVICDIDLISQNMTVETVKPLLTAKTKAIIAVHLAGWPCDMPALMALAKQHNLHVIEDCAQAHGARIDGKPVGSFGDLAAFSFCQDKIITTMGEGGLIAVPNTDLWQKIWSYKDHGKGYDTVHHQTHPVGFRWLHDHFGSNYRLTEAQSAIGRIQLKNLHHTIKARQTNAAILHRYFQDLSVMRVTRPPDNIKHAYYRYYGFIEAPALKAGYNRDRIMTEINASGILCGVGSCPEIYLEKAFMNHNLGPKQRLKTAQALGASSLAFMVDPIYTAEDIHQMGSIVRSILQNAQK